MDTSGSIRSSNKTGRGSVRFTPVEPALLAQAKQFLESLEFDLRIRQPLFPEKMAETIGKHVYYVLGSEYKFEPGFLICMPTKPTIFVNSRFQYGFHVRLRLHASIHQSGAVFIGTIDTLQAQIRFEDVWYFAGKQINRESYTQRYKTLSSFFQNCFVQDFRLSGLTASLATPTPLSTLKEKVESQLYNSIDLIPEQGGRRRWLLHLNAARPREEERPDFPTFMPTGTLATAPESVPIKKVIMPKSTTKPTLAIAEKIAGMPDTYDLLDSDGSSLGRGAVQNAEVSILLRESITKSKKMHVRIQWYEEFQRFKILGLLGQEGKTAEDEVQQPVSLDEDLEQNEQHEYV
jgi:hypothetical protein